MVNASTLVAVLYVFRHGQRAPYPPPFAANWSTAGSLWTDGRGFPNMTGRAWNMTDEAFAAQELTPHGKALLRHMGEHVARETAALGSDPCTRPSALFIADDSKRDQQSAEAFASGFYPNACAAARTVDIVVANESNGLTPTTSDDTQTGECPAGPDER